MPWPPKEPRECAECHATAILHAKGLCVNCYHRKAYQRRDPEQRRQNLRDWHQNHPEKNAEYCRNYKAKDPEGFRVTKNEQQAIRAATLKAKRNDPRYAAKLEAESSALQGERVRQLYEEPLDETPSERRCRLRRERNGETQ